MHTEFIENTRIHKGEGFFLFIRSFALFLLFFPVQLHKLYFNSSYFVFHIVSLRTRAHDCIIHTIAHSAVSKPILSQFTVVSVVGFFFLLLCGIAISPSNSIFHFFVVVYISFLMAYTHSLSLIQSNTWCRYTLLIRFSCSLIRSFACSAALFFCFFR